MKAPPAVPEAATARAPAGPAETVVEYLIRHFVGAVILLVVSVVTFAVVFLVPRLAGASPEDLAPRYAGTTADAEQTRALAEKHGFTRTARTKGLTERAAVIDPRQRLP